MKTKTIMAIFLVTLMSYMSGDDNGYVIKQTQKKKPKVNAQQCYEQMLSEMIWSSHVVTMLGQNQTQLLSYIDNALLEKADSKTLQKIMQEEQEYIKIVEEFAHAQKKHFAFHQEIKRELEAQTKK